MNILTKVFVVLMTIFSIALVSVVVPWVANVETYTQANKDLREELASAQAAQALAEASVSASAAQQKAEIQALEAEKNDLIALNNKLKEELGTLQLAHEDLKTDNARLKAVNANLSASHETFAALQKDLQQELRDRRDQAVNLERTVIQLEAENNDLASSSATFQRAMRRAQEQLFTTEEELTALHERLEQVDTGDRQNQEQVRREVPDVPLHGQVTRVQDAGEGNTLVQLNIGSTSGVKENMRFLLHRDGQYLGTVEITAVDEQAAAGRVRTLKPGAQIARGDAAWSGPAN